MLVLAMEFSRGDRPSGETPQCWVENDKRPAEGWRCLLVFPTRSNAPRKRNRDGPVVGCPVQEAEASTCRVPDEPSS
jgi:hypothetical protein